MINHDTFILLQTMTFSSFFQFYQTNLFNKKKLIKLKVYTTMIDQIFKEISKNYSY